jgi:putative sugar O-methyltransferase
MSRLDEMFEGLRGGRPEVLPSKYWEELNRTNLEQLATQGYDTFKRTLALNYFTFLVSRKDVQLKYLQSHLPAHVLGRCALVSALRGSHPGLSWKQSLLYTYLTLLLWEFARRTLPPGSMDGLVEPDEGGPFRVFRGGRCVSQDLANSALEVFAMRNWDLTDSGGRIVLELGAGYGRTAFAYEKLTSSGGRYIIADIPPALYVAEKYLGSQFPGKKIFAYRPFSSYEEVRADFESSEIAFLLPNQLPLLPAKSIDLFVNISSFHEMRMDQIAYYFGEVDRLTKGFFYFKEWKLSTIPFENVQIRETDYPVSRAWERVYHRECQVQTHFFEALYRL